MPVLLILLVVVAMAAGVNGTRQISCAEYARRRWRG